MLKSKLILSSQAASLPEDMDERAFNKQIFTGSLLDQHHWDAFIRGDESAFDRLYKSSFNGLFNYGMKLCHQHELVKDSIHDLFIDLWKYRSKPSRIHSIRPYLYKALRNIILKAQANNSSSLPVESAYHFTFDTSVETKLILQEVQDGEKQRLEKALNQLTQKQREVIFLKFFDQLSYEDVGHILGISTKATYKLVGRAIAFLRKKMIFILVLINLFG